MQASEKKYRSLFDDSRDGVFIEALRMAGADNSQADWEKERGAIEQEVASDNSNPMYVLQARARARVFAGTPYADTGLGTKESFDQTTGEMLKAFHDRWYAPNNALLVIAGDVDPPAVFNRINALFGDIPARPSRPGSHHPSTGNPGDLVLDDRPAVRIRLLYLPHPGVPESRLRGCTDSFPGPELAARPHLHPCV